MFALWSAAHEQQEAQGPAGREAAQTQVHAAQQEPAQLQLSGKSLAWGRSSGALPVWPCTHTHTHAHTRTGTHTQAHTRAGSLAC